MKQIVVAKSLGKVVGDGDREHQILRELNLTLHGGESVAIIGCSGVGKSTLLNLLGLLDVPSSGELLHDGQPLHVRQHNGWRNRNIGFVFQDCHLIESFTSGQNVLLPAQIGRFSKRPKASARARALELLQLCGLAERVDHPCRVMSGGERQRVAIARALMNEPRLILADEPSGNLDGESGKQIQQLLLDQVSENRCLCVVTHDIAFANSCQRVFRLIDGALQLVK